MPPFQAVKAHARATLGRMLSSGGRKKKASEKQAAPSNKLPEDGRDGANVDVVIVDGDPRWDHASFAEWAWTQRNAPFLRAGYLRELLTAALSAPSRAAGLQQLAADRAAAFMYHPERIAVGETQLFAVLTANFRNTTVGETSALETLKAFLDVLTPSVCSDDDLIFWDYLCFDFDDTKPEATRGAYKLFTYYRVQTVVLHHIAQPATGHTLFDLLEPMALLALATFCQRIVNAKDVPVDLTKMMHLPRTLDQLYCISDIEFNRIADMLEGVIRALKPVANDAIGFGVLCKEAALAWVPAPYFHELAARPGPVPRRQDLDPSMLIIGRPPAGRKIVVSHGWDSQKHIDPTGSKKRALAEALEALGATDEEDGIFVDFMSLPQKAFSGMPDLYFRANCLSSTSAMEDRTALEAAQFRFALWEMSRLYAFHECEVVVLPQSSAPHTFPQGTGEPLLRNGAVLLVAADGHVTLEGAADTGPLLCRHVVNQTGRQVRLMLSGLSEQAGETIEAHADGVSVTLSNCCAWGAINTEPYERRGWCCSEYSIARFTGRIVERLRPAELREIEASRRWPSSVSEYDEMMQPSAHPRVSFTFNGDRDVVKFIFYRICFGLLHSFSLDEWQGSLRSYEPPSETALSQAEARLASNVGNGNPDGEYYLYVLLQRPPLIDGVEAGHRSYLEVLRALELSLLTSEQTWRRRGRWPICISGCEPSVGAALSAARRLRCLVWAAHGVGWETSSFSMAGGIRATHAPSLAFPDLCELLRSLPDASRPEVMMVVMPYGARLAAQALTACGISRVVWLRASMASVDDAVALLLGGILRILEAIEQPLFEGHLEGELTEAIIKVGRQHLFGGRASTWNGAGCLLRRTGGTEAADAPHRYVVPSRWRPPAVSRSSGLQPYLHQANVRNGRVSSHLIDLLLGQDDGVGHVELHEELMISAVDGRGVEVDLLAVYGADRLRQWLRAALPKTERLCIAALFADESPERRTPRLQVRLHFPNVGFLHELRDLLLDGRLDNRLKREALAMHGVAGDMTRFSLAVRVDRVRFASTYEASVLSLEKLTPHQREKMEQCLDGAYVSVRAPAGAGKTFVALHRMRLLLDAECSTLILFVARNEALCTFVARWLCSRLPNALQRLRLLRRLHLLFEPFAIGPRTVTVERGRGLVVTPSEELLPKRRYALVVVDEAHHVYSDGRMLTDVERVATAMGGPERRLLLSDVSQAADHKFVYPRLSDVEKTDVLLTEVVRCSQRILMGASAFELSPDKAETAPQHGAVGPPLKSFIFAPAPEGVSDASLMRSYARHVLLALDHVSSTFGSDFVLHDRVALIVPDAAFAAQLHAPLLAALRSHYGERFALVSANEAACVLSGGGGSGREHIQCAPQPMAVATESLVLDELSNFDGLERLVVITVGLDSPVGLPLASVDQLRQSRSAMYRAITRAQMLACVVNVHVSDGWLAFLGHVKLRPDDKFDLLEEHDAADAEAVGGLVDEKERRAEAPIQEARATDVALGSSESTPEDGESANGVNLSALQKPKAMQSVWDASSNAEVAIDSLPAFMPFKQALDEAQLAADPKVWEQGGEVAHELPCTVFDVGDHLALAEDGKTLVGHGADGSPTTLSVYDMMQGTVIRVMRGHRSPVQSVAVGGNLVVSGDSSGSILLWSLSDGAQRGELQSAGSRAHGRDVFGLAIAPGSQLLVSGSHDNTLKLWNLESKEHTATLRGHQAGVNGVHLTGAGGVASAGQDRTARVWKLDGSVTCTHTLSHPAKVYSVCASADLVVTGCQDGKVRLFSLPTGALTRALDGHRSWCNTVRLLGSLLISGSTDCSIKVWALDQSEPLASLEAHTNMVLGLVISPTNGRIASLGQDGKIFVWKSLATTPPRLTTVQIEDFKKVPTPTSPIQEEPAKRVQIPRKQGRRKG